MVCKQVKIIMMFVHKPFSCQTLARVSLHCTVYNLNNRNQILVMRITTTFFTSSLPSLNLTRRKCIVNEVPNTSLSDSNAKKAHLYARKKERIKLPIHDADTYHISEFFRHPSGVEAILNTKALQSFQPVDINVYRCSLPALQLLNFEVAPIMDLRVTPSDEDCTLEMLSCKFEGSNIVERQNDHFSASMRNHITWETNGTDSYMNIDVKLKLILEIYTKPFSLLPISAVERPGNLMMQALVDRLVPLLLEQVLQDYNNWVLQKPQNSEFGLLHSSTSKILPKIQFAPKCVMSGNTRLSAATCENVNRISS